MHGIHAVAMASINTHDHDFTRAHTHKNERKNFFSFWNFRKRKENKREDLERIRKLHCRGGGIKYFTDRINAAIRRGKP